jgi:predicted acyl esterase
VLEQSIPKGLSSILSQFLVALSFSLEFHFHKPLVDHASSGATGHDAYIGENGYQGFNPHSEVLHKGGNGHNARPLPLDIIVVHDVSIKVRDGCTPYCDVYRPLTSGPDEKVSAFVAWNPFGKKFNGIRSTDREDYNPYSGEGPSEYNS